MSATKTHMTGLRTVSVPVDDQDAALGFYVDRLGFTPPEAREVWAVRFPTRPFPQRTPIAATG